MMADSIGDPPSALAAPTAVIAVLLLVGVGVGVIVVVLVSNGERMVEVANEQPPSKMGTFARFRQ